MTKYLGINIDLERDKLFDELGIKRLQESYMKDDETSPQHRFAFVSKAFGTNLAHSQRLYDYSSRHWLSYSTPILSFGRSKRGLPISCFLNYIEDTAANLCCGLVSSSFMYDSCNRFIPNSSKSLSLSKSIFIPKYFSVISLPYSCYCVINSVIIGNTGSKALAQATATSLCSFWVPFPLRSCI